MSQLTHPVAAVGGYWFGATFCLPPFGGQMGAVLFLLIVAQSIVMPSSRRGETVRQIVRVPEDKMSSEIRHCPPN